MSVPPLCNFDYYYFITNHFNVSLTPVQAFLEKGVPIAVADELPIEQIVHDSLPAIVQIHAGEFSGSGFLITSAGLVATNAHVVEGQKSITVVTSDGNPLPSTNIYVDHDRDLALIKVDAHDVPFLPLSAVTDKTKVFRKLLILARSKRTHLYSAFINA